MNLELSGKTALVTGASSVGIARVIAQTLAAEGVQVAISARRRSLLEEVAHGVPGFAASELYHWHSHPRRRGFEPLRILSQQNARGVQMTRIPRLSGKVFSSNDRPGFVM